MQTALTDEERRAVARTARASTLDALKALGGEARREDIRRRALELAAFDARQLAAPAPPKAQHKFDSLVEHAMAWALTDLRRGGLVENPAGRCGASSAPRPGRRRWTNGSPSSACASCGP